MSATSSRNSDLRAYILELIRQRGKLSFAEFMNEALYSQRGGYYRHVVPGTDYYTAPLAHPAFGTLLTLWMLKLNSTLDQNATPQIVEIGAANGIMARNGVQYARQHKPETELNYRAYDLSPPATPLPGRNPGPTTARRNRLSDNQRTPGRYAGPPLCSPRLTTA